MIVSRTAAVGAALATLGLTALGPAQGFTLSPAYVETFDPPNFPQGSSLFVTAGPAETIVDTAATFSGGVLLGFATNLPAQIFSTDPNVLGTASVSGIQGVSADPTLLETLNIAIQPSYTADQVSFVLFNGNTVPVSYIANAYSGSSLVASQTLANLAANSQGGFGTIDLLDSSGLITSVTVAPVGAPAAWDYAIDTVSFNESIQQAVSPVPEPATWSLIAIGLGLMVAIRRRARFVEFATAQMTPT